MLVLSRKTAKSSKGKKNPKLTTIRIGQGITVTVLEIRGENVRVGVDAPAGTPVLRGELADLPEPLATAAP
ncbi:MAG: carbon storage regulator [Candidatus Peribacteraceae bacterium]